MRLNHLPMSDYLAGQSILFSPSQATTDYAIDASVVSMSISSPSHSGVVRFVREAPSYLADFPNRIFPKFTEKVAEIALAMSELRDDPTNLSQSDVSAPSMSQFDIAAKTLTAFLFDARDFPVPKVILQNNGTFAACWRKNKNYISVDFDEDGEFPWAMSDGENSKSGIWRSASSVPHELARVLLE
ncbi:MAG: hypothetical protein PGN26_02740 [Xylophilus ampelinus]